jgi:hypothetical protein
MAAVVLKSEQILRWELDLVQELQESNIKLQALTIDAEQWHIEMDGSLGMRVQELEDAHWINKDLAALIKKLLTRTTNAHKRQSSKR